MLAVRRVVVGSGSLESVVNQRNLLMSSLAGLFRHLPSVRPIVRGAAIAGVALALPMALAGTAMAQTCTVTSTADTGAGTLRSCLTSPVSGTTISFNLPSPSTITLVSALPAIGTNLTI
jgi:hypothetical protein